VSSIESVSKFPDEGLDWMKKSVRKVKTVEEVKNGKRLYISLGKFAQTRVT
jgi:hypothetical protein